MGFTWLQVCPSYPPAALLCDAEKYLREVWPAVTRALKEVGVGCELNLVEGSMTVRTTRKVRAAGPRCFAVLGFFI